jgi:hypothetical protein
MHFGASHGLAWSLDKYAFSSNRQIRAKRMKLIAKKILERVRDNASRSRRPSPQQLQIAAAAQPAEARQEERKAHVSINVPR